MHSAASRSDTDENIDASPDGDTKPIKDRMCQRQGSDKVGRRVLRSNGLDGHLPVSVRSGEHPGQRGILEDPVVHQCRGGMQACQCHKPVR